MVGINLVLTQKMQETAYLVLMHMEEHNDAAKAKKANTYPFCSLEVINKFLDILTNNLLAILLLNKDVNHKIEMHLGSIPPAKAPYWLNQKRLEEFKRQINELME